MMPLAFEPGMQLRRRLEDQEQSAGQQDQVSPGKIECANRE
jgi:hypothetical protein